MPSFAAQRATSLNASQPIVTCPLSNQHQFKCLHIRQKALIGPGLTSASGKGCPLRLGCTKICPCKSLERISKPAINSTRKNESLARKHLKVERQRGSLQNGLRLLPLQLIASKEEIVLKEVLKYETAEHYTWRGIVPALLCSSALFVTTESATPITGLRMLAFRSIRTQRG